MSIIISGASGQFGRATAELLLQTQDPATLILTSRTPAKLADLAARGAQVRHADFDDPATLDAAFQGGTRMMLISTARVGTRVGQHRNGIEAAVRAGVTHIAYTSLLGAAEPDNPALVKLDHRATEEIMESSGAAWTFLRDSQYAEAASDVIAPVAIMNGEYPSNCGDGRVAFVSRDDCVACAAAVLTKPGHENRAYDLTGPELWSYPQLIAELARMTGKALSYRFISDDETFAFFDAMGAPRHASDIVPDGPIPWSSDDMVTFGQSIREGYFDVITDHVEQLTGRKPKSLVEVLRASQPRWPQ
jgi:NAD(P)H dehydrogenase (quinone)